MWTAVIITCNETGKVPVIQSELEILQKKGKIDKNTILLTVEDPEKGVGSGSATLNALLVVAEHLSVKNDYQVITADVLHDAHILIFHYGRDYPFDPIGKAFQAVPLAVTSYNQPARLITNLEILYTLVSDIAYSADPGIWVCSTEMILSGQVPKLCFPKDCDVLLFSTLESIDYATQHGAIEVLDEKFVANIVYMGAHEQLQLFSEKKDKIPIVSGIVFLSAQVAESLLSLHVMTPIDSCTYLGVDNGAKSLQVSLYFDILVAMATKSSEEKYISGEYCKSYNARRGFNVELLKSTQHARRLVWNELHKYKMKTCILSGMNHNYWNEAGTAAEHAKTIQKFSNFHFIHSSVTETKLPDRDLPLIVNSFIQKASLGKNSIIQHCHLQGSTKNQIEIGKSTYLIGVHIENELIPLNVKDEMVVIEMTITDAGCVKKIRLLFGMHDIPFAPFHSSEATFCNVPWNKLFDGTGLHPNDLWNNKSEVQCLMTARLFPPSTDTKMLNTLQNLHHISLEQLNQWRDSYRLSLSEVLSKASLEANFVIRRQLFNHLTSVLIRETLLNNKDYPLMPYFKCSVIENWHLNLLNTLDKIAASFDNNHWDPGKAARTLACIADLLGVLAGKDGGLRSGPAANQSWAPALNILDQGVKGSIENGVKALTLERANWLDSPIKLTRAARHYEGAAQILIRHAVMTANEFAQLGITELPPMGQWVIGECPARVDIQGGWSDTPPICYELGGSVVNIALLVNGKRPIGAKAKRIPEPVIDFLLGPDVSLAKKITITDIRSLCDYRHLMAAGALLKAAVIYAGVVDLQSEASLKDQLLSKYGGGIVLHTWSNLPEGSGLGTSSILAGAIVGVLWTLTGKTWTKSAVVHAVLCLEQMLTSGGGWQDQVGGIIGGINFASSSKYLPIKVKVESLSTNLSKEFIQKLNQHIVLVYTGKVRLAKNLLQNVIRNWYARDAKVVECFQELVRNAQLCKEAIMEENIEKLGALMNRYWEQKIIIAPGCDPIAIRKMMTQLQPLVHGQTLAGAGGGGFIVLLTKEPNMNKQIENTLHDIQMNANIYHTEIDITGMVMSCKLD